MIESGIREGIATRSHRHAKANNEYMEAEFDPTKESKCISYVNAFTLDAFALLGDVETISNVWI